MAVLAFYLRTWLYPNKVKILLLAQLSRLKYCQAILPFRGKFAREMFDCIGVMLVIVVVVVVLIFILSSVLASQGLPVPV